MRYQYISYDVWGNETDGYEVNQTFTTNQYVQLNEDMTDSEIIDSLISQDFARDTVNRDLIHIDGELGFSLYFEYDGKPEFELRAVSDN